MEKRYKRITSNIIEILKRPDIQILPGQLAFFFILSLVPTLTITFYIAAFMHISIMDVVNHLNIAITEELIDMITPLIGSIKLTPSLFILLAVGTFLASNGMNSIIVTANSIYGITESSLLKRRIKAIIMVFVLIFLFLFIVIVPGLGNFLFGLLEEATGYGGIQDFLNFLSVPFSWFMIFFFIKLLYTMAPDKEIPSSYVNIGAMFTSIGWILTTEIYIYYVKHFAHYSLFYSGLSNIAILMIWLYILATIFVIGMALNSKEEPYEIEKNKKNIEVKELQSAKKTQIKKLKEK